LNSLAYKSDGLSIRSLEDLVDDAVITLNLNKSDCVDETVLLKILADSKKKFTKNKSDDSQSPPESTLQKLSMIITSVSGLLGIALTTYHVMGIAAYMYQGSYPGWYVKVQQAY
jgi:hypothetical protein